MKVPGSIAEKYPSIAELFAEDSPIQADEVTAQDRVQVKAKCPVCLIARNITARNLCRGRPCRSCVQGRKSDPRVVKLLEVKESAPKDFANKEQIPCATCGELRWISKKDAVRAKNGKYLALCGSCGASGLQVGVNDLATLYPKIAKLLSPNASRPAHLLTANAHRDEPFFCIECGIEFVRRVANFVQFSQRCKKCANRQSEGERELISFIRSIYSKKILEGDRKILSGKELDIYLPALKLAIEYNGNYWHSDMVLLGKLGVTASERHQTKVDHALLKGIRVAFVWEDDWHNSKEEVKFAIQEFIATGIAPEMLTKLSNDPRFDL